MREEGSIRRDLFNSKQAKPAVGERVDKQRIGNYRFNDSERDDEKADQKMKRVININIFREQTRRQQRDFHQQNHQYLKMCGIMVRSSFDQNKFLTIGKDDRQTNNFSKGNANNKNIHKKESVVHVPLDNVTFSCALVQNQFPVKQLYQIFPMKRDSIIFQSHEELSSQFIFFLYEYENKAADDLKLKLSNIQEGILTQFKNSINKALKNISFFDYLYFVNKKNIPNSKQEREVAYPPQIMDIAFNNTNYLSRIDEEEKDTYNREQIFVNEQETCERVIVCEETDVVDNGQNLCFQNLQEYTAYKMQKAIDFKNQKIFQKDVIVNTNIRNIISTQKIYLVQIIEEVRSYIRLSQECDGTSIMGKVYQHLINKADQYLRLLCGYTESKILTIYNIQNYQQKIYTFLEKSVRYKKELRNISQEVLKEFPVLQIWFKLPQNLLGYSREQLHQAFYDLMEAIIIFEEKMRANDLYQSLKKKRNGIKYIEG